MAQDPLHVLWIEPQLPGPAGRGGRLAGEAPGLSRARFTATRSSRARPGPRPSGKGLDVQVFGVGGIAREQAVSWSRTLERSLCYSYGCWEVLEKKTAAADRPDRGPIDGAGLEPVRAGLLRRRLRWSTSSITTITPTATTWPARPGPRRPRPTFTGGGRWPRSICSTWSRPLWAGLPRSGSADSIRLSTATSSWCCTTASTPGVSSGRRGKRPGHTRLRSIAGRVDSGLDAGRQLRGPLAGPRSRVRPVPHRWPTPCCRSDPDVLCVVVGDPIVRRGLDVDVSQPRLRRSPDERRIRRSIRDRLWFVGNLRRPRSLPRSWPPATCTWPRAGPTRWPGRCWRRWPPAASSWPPIPSRIARSSSPGDTGLLVDGQRHRGRWRAQALAVLADLAAFRPLGDAAGGDGARIDYCPGCLSAAARRGRFRRWRPPGGTGRERPVHPRRLPRPVRPSSASSSPGSAAGGAASWCRASRAARPPHREMLRDARAAPRCRWSAEHRSSDGIPWPQIYGHYLEQCRIRSTTRSRPCRTCGPTSSSLTAAEARRPCFCARCVDCPIIIYCEYYFANSHRDISYRIDLPPAEPAPFFPRCINAPTLATLVDCDAGYSATHWQKQSFPRRFHSKIEVHFDGIDTALYHPGPAPRQIGETVDSLRHARGHVRIPRTRVDPWIRPVHEGCPPHIAQARSDVIFVVAGGEEIHYGWDKLHTGAPSFKQWVLRQDRATTWTGLSSPGGSCPSNWPTSSG